MGYIVVNVVKILAAGGRPVCELPHTQARDDRVRIVWFIDACSRYVRVGRYLLMSGLSCSSRRPRRLDWYYRPKRSILQ